MSPKTSPQTITIGRRVFYGVTIEGKLVPAFADVLAVDEQGLPKLEIHAPDGSMSIQTRARESRQLTEGFWIWPPRIPGGE